MTLNATASRAAKDRGQQMSIMFDGEWTAAVLVELEAWIATRRAQGFTEMTFEQFRADAIAHPSSHKGWGALPAIACRAGLIAPMNHPDGSPVMRAAESVKTHGHFVRVWRLAGTDSPTLIEQPRPAGANPTTALVHVGHGAFAEVHDGR
jgi:hypothetical protein